jgi:hypothetical protein
MLAKNPGEFPTERSIAFDWRPIPTRVVVSDCASRNGRRTHRVDLAGR